MLALSPRRRFAPLCRAIGTRRPPRRWSSQDIASPESVLENGRLPALVWKIRLLHGAQTRLVENAAIAGDAPGTLSRLGTERIQGQCAALPKITQEIPVGRQACHGGQRGNQAAAAPASCCACKEGYGD